MIHDARIEPNPGRKNNPAKNLSYDSITREIGQGRTVSMARIVRGSFREDDDTILIFHVDSPGIHFRTLFVTAGAHFEPDPEQHIAIHLHSNNVKASANTQNVTPGVALILGNKTNISSWKQHSAELTTLQVAATSAAHTDQQIALTKDGKHGVGVNDDGSFIAHSPGGTIVGGTNGIFIAGKQVIIAVGEVSQYGIFKDPPSVTKYLPSLFFFPNASKWPSPDLVTNVGGIVASAGSIVGELS